MQKPNDDYKNPKDTFINKQTDSEPINVYQKNEHFPNSGVFELSSK